MDEVHCEACLAGKVVLPVRPLTCTFLWLGSGACGASWVRGSPLALLALFVCEVCLVV